MNDQDLNHDTQEIEQVQIQGNQVSQESEIQQKNIEIDQNCEEVSKNEKSDQEGEFIIIDENTKKEDKDINNQKNEKVSLKKRKYSKHYKKLFKQNLDNIVFRINDPIEKFQVRGEGVYFYFYFIKFFAIVFFIAGLISIASLVLNISGNGLQASGLQIMLRTTVGNLELVRFDADKIKELKNLPPAQRDDYVKQENSHLHVYQMVHMYSDFIVNIIFFVAIYIFQHKVNQKSEKINEVYPSIRNYTIMVKGINGKNDQKQKIQEYFDNFGQVEQIDFAYSYNNCLYHLVKISKNYQEVLKIEEKEILEEKKIKKFSKKLKSLKKHMKVIMQKNNAQNFNFKFFKNFDIVYVFVTYNHNKTPKRIIQDFEKAHKKSLKQFLMCQKKEVDKKYKYEDKDLKISIPDHPQNIIWENMEFSQTYRRKRKVFLALISFVIIIISLLINVILTALQEDSHEISCDNTTITYETVMAATGQHKMETIYCYCQQFSFFHFFKNQNTNDFKLCEPFYVNQIEFFAINIGIGFLISLTNYIIEIIIIKCTELIKYEQITQLMTKQMIYTFVVEYINTAFILLFIYAEINGFAIIRFFNQIIEHDIFKINNFLSSFNRKWYENVASNLITPLLISVFSPHLLDLVYIICKKYYLRRFKKKELEKQDFDVSSNLKEILKLVIICYTFSAGIQIYYHFVYAGMALMYWTQKYMFVYNSTIPPPLSKKFIQKVYPLLKATLIIHMMFSVLFYSNDDIFPMRLNVQLEDTRPHKPEPNLSFSHILSRTIPIVIQICLFLVVYIVELIFDKPFIFFQKLIFRNKKLTKIESLELDKECNEMKKNKNDRYDIMNNQNYKEIFNFQDEKLEKVKEIIKDSTLQDLVQFKSMNNFKQKSRTFTKLVSIEMENLKNETQLTLQYQQDQKILFLLQLDQNLYFSKKFSYKELQKQKRNP